MAESKSAALPLGYAPSGCCRNGARKPTLRHRRSIEGVGLFQQARPLNSGKNGPAAPVSICSCLYIVAAECNGGLLCRGRREPPWRPSRADRTVETIAVSWEDGSPLFPFGDKSRRVPLMTYRAPISDILLALNHGAGLKAAVQAGHYGDFDGDITAAVLEEAGKFAGQVLPLAINAACTEIWSASNIAFGLCPLLSLSAIEALDAHGSEELKKIYLEKLVTGEWTGTMQLTEPQAGSDVGALRTRAERADDGSYRIKGTKIFITYGEHDMTDNIVHFVLARLPDAPAGTKGISLFLIPKFLVNPDGSLGARNDIHASGVEHKLGMHASPTCTMTMGDRGGAIGYLVGEENAGMRCMFTMMNQARLGVGLEGVGVADRAYQQALAIPTPSRPTP